MISKGNVTHFLRNVLIQVQCNLGTHASSQILMPSPKPTHQLTPDFNRPLAAQILFQAENCVEKPWLGFFKLPSSIVTSEIAMINQVSLSRSRLLH
ncbi:hypothetical protein V6Z11_D08G124500 [Gossypium hirsutum]